MKLVWTNAAVADLRALRRYSVERWGQAVALRYMEDVRDAAKRAAAAPERTRPLRGALRLMRVRSHCLIVHCDREADRLTVARVLHVAMDIERHLT